MFSTQPMFLFFIHFDIQSENVLYGKELDTVGIFLQMGRKNVEKENILVTSIYSFSHKVFKRFLSQGCSNLWLFG